MSSDGPHHADASIRASPENAAMRRRRFANLRWGWLLAPASTLLLYWLRAPQTFLHPQLWAEDGVIFFAEQRSLGVKALFAPYAGYLHLAPRLVAMMASHFSAVSLPAFYAWTSVALCLWSAATIAATRLPFAWLLGATLLLPPHSGEIFGTLTNVQWLMAPGLAMSVAAPSPLGRGARINQFAFCLVAGLTGPFPVFLAPVAGWRGWVDRHDPHRVALCAIICATAMIQAWTIVTHSAPHGPILEAGDLARAIIDRTIGQLATGHRSSTALDAMKDVLVSLAALSVLSRRRATFAGLFGFTALFLGAVWLKFSDLSFHIFDGTENGDRYFFIPRLILLWAIIVTTMVGIPRRAVLGSAALVTIGFGFSHWQKADMIVLPWKPFAQKIDRGEAVSIIINPASSPDDGWTLVVPARIPAAP